MVFSNSNAASIIEPIIVDPWDNEHPIEHLLRRGEAGKKVPHVLFLSGRKDNIVAPWHMDHLWSKFEQGSKSFIRTFHHFAEGGHTCHREPNYHRRIDAFLRTIFEK